jgi:GH25 family lysozyme M1 (1,4-beta-N-acetylmuramidase)
VLFVRPETRHLRHRLASPSPIALVALLATLIGVGGVLASPTEVLGGTTQKVAACAVNLRTHTSTGSTIKRTIKSGTTVTIESVVLGGKWSATCAGGRLGDRHWAKVTAINGKSIKSLYGHSFLFGAAAMFNDPTRSSRYARCNSIGLRTGTSTSTALKGKLTAGTKVTVVASVGGSAWEKTCLGLPESGTYWYRIKAINGTSVRTLYGVKYVYAASRLLSSTVTATGISEGIDVSHWQGTIDWSLVRQAGKRFAFIKASEGQTYNDPMYPTNRSGAKTAGLVIGAYHFANPSQTSSCDLRCDARKEADHFIATASWASGEMRPVLDLEKSGGFSDSDLQTWVRVFLNRIYNQKGVRGVIYVSPSFWSNYMGNTQWFATNGYDVLWIAHWTTASGPTVPANNWGGHGWTFWQYSSSGTVAGIEGRVDLDRYNGLDFSKVLLH